MSQLNLIAEVDPNTAPPSLSPLHSFDNSLGQLHATSYRRKVSREQENGVYIAGSGFAERTFERRDSLYPMRDVFFCGDVCLTFQQAEVLRRQNKEKIGPQNDQV